MLEQWRKHEEVSEEEGEKTDERTVEKEETDRWERSDEVYAAIRPSDVRDAGNWPRGPSSRRAAAAARGEGDAQAAVMQRTTLRC